ncbi:insecticidal toxin protein [Desertimonas flava]|uniref:Tc toxin subunit A-related protein n=1 Tax=Desertimonas flava TaxID=2064846 RepID=UPI000E354AA5|nr:insecticidal toxin protein [Desertimonas flava]
MTYEIDPTASFHLADDAYATTLIDANRYARWFPRESSHTEQRRTVVRERNLTYRFSPHYHAWATELTRRLIGRGVKGLQAADTEHQLRLVLSAAVAGSLGGEGGADVTVAAGETVTIPDDVRLTLVGQGPVHVAGRHLVSGERPIIPAVGAEVVVPAGVVVTRADRRAVLLRADMTATLRDDAPRPTLLREIFSSYAPNAALVPDTALSPHPADDLDFTPGGAYSVYNWELFFHVPFTIAVHLSRSGRYAEAMQWLHLLFDPTDTSSQLAPERYWKVKPFQTTEVERIEQVLVNLSTGDDPVLERDTINAIQAWKDAPFRPHVVARFRQSAYMFKTVMAYLDNLVAWGDSLFRQDTGEAIDEALQLYVLAAVILGPRPQPVPSKGSVRTQNYATLRRELDEFGNTMRTVEGSLLFDLAPRPTSSTSGSGLTAVRSIGRSLYFGVPRNDRLLGYWDTVADRLFKIRNSLNLQGVFRQIPVFEPPIDPALLARAAAAGLDTSAIVAGTAQQLPRLRFALLHRQATELAQQVAALGTSLLATMEKADGEELSLLRVRHERTLATLTKQVKYGQLLEATKTREAVVASLDTAITRYAFYEQQLGRSLGDIEVPELDELDLQQLAAYNLRAAEPTVAPRDVPIDIATDVIDEAAGRLLNRFEAAELDLLTTARTIQDVIKIAQLAGQASSMIPDFGVKFHFWGLGGDFGFGGTQLAKFARFAADVALTVADQMSFGAGVAAKVGGYARREQDWAHQSNLAAGEISQVFKQLRAAQLREAVAEREWHNHQVELAQLEEVEQFLNSEGAHITGRAANKALYTWLKREVRALYSRTFAVATEAAAKAQLALQHEVGRSDLTFVGTDYLSGNEGLLAGEKLLFDLTRMELAYHEHNERELEMIRHVSLAQLDPLALLRLRATGTCRFDVPEELFDLDGPGHYFRRIRAVSMSMPCVTGPHTSVNATLRLVSSAIRRTDTSELEEQRGPAEAVMMSTGADDPGVFDASGADHRRLPFELAGAVSSWQIDLPGLGPQGYRTFDYDTITDVVLHMKFTAREGNRAPALARLKALTEGAKEATRVRLFSLRHEFPAAWATFKATPGDTAPITVTLTRSMFPYWSAKLRTEIETAMLYRPPAVVGDEPVQVEIGDAGIPEFDEPWTVTVEREATRDLWLLATWTT